MPDRKAHLLAPNGYLTLCSRKAERLLIAEQGDPPTCQQCQIWQLRNSRPMSSW